MNGQMEKEKQIEEMESVIFESSPVPSLWHSDAHKMAETLYNAGYRKERQGECEYCKTGNEKCGTCAYFIGIDTNDALDRCSEYYGEDKCVKYKPTSYCFNCGAKMKGE